MASRGFKNAVKSRPSLARWKGVLLSNQSEASPRPIQRVLGDGLEGV